ncbi:hypothetical protein BFR88_07500 [Acinetobacter pittii]|uniref:hypothetical protein n=1 Tax=Acinetobacter pittii TaxID=48296 RepID=UPI00083975E4|nr:hypothetical protein [Acinetobacter pittii]MDC4343623.1 hypothetical protein [Acinetobacter baumannii]OCY76569.1 hypothetical protein BFR86_01335 [Acinetobacter pittii]OCY79807.1 hypothetical protein BFR88_07500 [Acinetobacter pittii]OCY82632.1 hypothetical protein BFR87_04610 [Acinetobacter pittii]OCZ24028.1 hypothetical protein BFR96_02915 [Acinetobacter pittii]
MEQKLLGELFDVQIHTPIARSEVREVLRKQLEFKAALQVEKGLTEDQAFLEVSDIFDAFFASISEEDKSNFEKIHSEEINAAPKEWFGDLLENNEDDEFIKTGIAGFLYDIEVKYPFTRDNIRTIVQARSNLMRFLASTHGVSVYQASNDLSDEQKIFTEKLSLADQEKFLNLMTEEMNAYTNALNDETLRINQQAFKQEISNINLTNTMSGIIVFCCLMFLFFIVFK